MAAYLLIIGGWCFIFMGHQRHEMPTAAASKKVFISTARALVGL
jgi:hypothetical protein